MHCILLYCIVVLLLISMYAYFSCITICYHFLFHMLARRALSEAELRLQLCRNHNLNQLGRRENGVWTHCLALGIPASGFTWLRLHCLAWIYQLALGTLPGSGYTWLWVHLPLGNPLGFGYTLLPVHPEPGGAPRARWCTQSQVYPEPGGVPRARCAQSQVCPEAGVPRASQPPEPVQNKLLN